MCYKTILNTFIFTVLPVYYTVFVNFANAY